MGQDGEVGLPVCVFLGHDAAVSFMDFHRTAPEILLSSSFDGTCRVWGLHVGCLHVLQNGPSPSSQPVTNHLFVNMLRTAMSSAGIAIMDEQPANQPRDGVAEEPTARGAEESADRRTAESAPRGPEEASADGTPPPQQTQVPEDPVSIEAHFSCPAALHHLTPCDDQDLEVQS